MKALIRTVFQVQSKESAFMGNSKEIGQLGEDIACRYLRERGYSIEGQNYLKKWGEIDVIAKKGGKLHFIEVKAVSYESSRESASWETSKSGGYRPEENVHPDKLRRLARVIQTYLLDTKNDEAEWQLDVLTVHLDREKREARVGVIADIVL